MRNRVRRLVVVGSILGELRVHVPNQPEPGGSVRAERNVAQAGGCFRTVATARRLGLPAVLVGRVGEDPTGKLMQAALKRENIDIAVPATAGEHGYTVVAIDCEGVASSIEIAGVEATLTREEIDHVLIEPGDAVLVLGSDLVSEQTGAAICEWIRDGGPGEATLVFAPGRLMSDIPDAVFDMVLRRTDILTTDRTEFALLTGVTEAQDRPDAAMGLLETLAPSAVLLGRVAGEGCWLVTAEGGTWFASPSSPSSPTDCGATQECRLSAHLGIFLAELARLDDPLQAARIATIGWTQVPGPQRPWVTSIGPDRAQLEQLVAAANAAQDALPSSTAVTDRPSGRP